MSNAERNGTTTSVKRKEPSSTLVKNYAHDDIVFIQGKITRVVFPKNFEPGNRESDNEFAIVKVNNDYSVKGDIPVLDYTLNYRFACVPADDPKYGPGFKIIFPAVAQRKQIKAVEITVPPITLSLFLTLFRAHGYTLGEAQKFTDCFRLALKEIGGGQQEFTNESPIHLKNLRDYFILTNPLMSSRLESLVNTAHYFKAESSTRLALFWSADDLATFSTTQLFQICETLQHNPWSFCFRWLNEYDGLPEFTPLHLQKWKLEFISCNQTILRALLIPFDHMIAIVTMYHKFKKQVKWTHQLRISALHLNFTLEECLALSHACSQKIFKLFPNLDLVLYETNMKMALLGAQINQLKALHATIRAPPRTLAPESVERFSDEQMVAVDRIVNDTTRVLLVVGDAGTGKTFISKAMFSMFPASMVLAVAAYGRTAKKLRTILGGENAYTIMMAIQCGLSRTFPKDWRYSKRGAQHQEEEGVEDEEYEGEEHEHEQQQPQILPAGKLSPWEGIRVLIVEELGVVTCTLLQKLLSFMPNLLYLIMFGDEKQMSPVESDSIIHSFVQRYEGTLSFQRLTRNFRSEHSHLSHLLVENFQKIACGNPQIRYTRSVEELNEVPFLVVQRTDPTAAQMKGTNEQKRKIAQHCIEQDIEKIITHFGTGKGVQIITQKNVVRKQINTIAFRLDKRFQNQVAFDSVDRKMNIFLIGEKVVFLKNFYGTRESKQLPTHLLSSAVMRGEIKVLTGIEDYNPIEPNEQYFIAKTSTIQEKQKGHCRMLLFEDGSRVNTSTYPLCNISKAYACTTASEQGEEVDVIIIYIEKDCGPHLTRSVFYTAVTRARQTVVLVCNPAVDLPKIIGTKPPAPNYELAEFLT